MAVSAAPVAAAAARRAAPACDIVVAAGCIGVGAAVVGVCGFEDVCAAAAGIGECVAFAAFAVAFAAAAAVLLLQDLPLQQSAEIYLEGNGRPGAVNAFAVWLDFYEQHNGDTTSAAAATAAAAEEEEKERNKEKCLLSSKRSSTYTHAHAHSNGSSAYMHKGLQQQHHQQQQQQQQQQKEQQHRLFFSTAPQRETPDSASSSTPAAAAAATATAAAAAEGRHRGRRQVKQSLFWVSPVLLQRGEGLRVKVEHTPTKLSLRLTTLNPKP